MYRNRYFNITNIKGNKNMELPNEEHSQKTSTKIKLNTVWVVSINQRYK